VIGGSRPNGTMFEYGDFQDSLTSVNSPWFFLFHANLDRIFFRFMTVNAGGLIFFCSFKQSSLFCILTRSTLTH
jgi:hypothetical protein